MLMSRTGSDGLGKKAVKVLASITRGIARDSVDNRCWLLIHHPSEPKDLAKRLNEMCIKQASFK